jgi:hypothetical protein
MNAPFTRRRFLKVTGAAVAAPVVVPAAALGKDGHAAPSARITLGMIGSGNRAGQLAALLLGMADAQIIATCDPVRQKRQALKAVAEKAYADRLADGSFRGCADYNDFRDLLGRADVDAVFITSPENWHALHGIAAARAKKDIYVEKAMTRTVAEGQALVKAVRENQRVAQVGQQQRSDSYFRVAVELAQRGELGKLHTIKVGNPGNRAGPEVRPQPVPEGTDYDLWLGPAPLAPYQPERLINLVWMSTYDYVIGYEAGWGCHNADIAQWGNNADGTGPVEVESRRSVFPTSGICNCPLSWHSEMLYANGVRMIFASEDEIPMGIRFEGSEARVYVNRGRIEAGPVSFKSVLRSKLPPVRGDAETAHLRNFLECVKSRQDPRVPVEIGHRTNIVCHLSAIASRLRRKLHWNPEKEQFIGDDEANKMLSRDMRPPWHV